MLAALEDLLQKENVTLYQTLDFSVCSITKPHLLRSFTDEPKSVLLFAIPYYTNNSCPRLSKYAQGYDYHLYFRDFFDRCIARLKTAYPNHQFAAFADHSPIDERKACAHAKLGCIGDNGLLLTKEYGSYVFLGEIISDLSLGKQNQTLPPVPICNHCGACKAACPMPENCLSAVTQKKHSLTQGEIAAMKTCNTAWGCDICQDVCPLNAYIKPTPISFFHNGQIKDFSVKSITEMSDAELASRAFSWRGKETVLRNLCLLEER